MRDVLIAAIPALVALAPVLSAPRKRKLLRQVSDEAVALKEVTEPTARQNLLQAHQSSARLYLEAISGTDARRRGLSAVRLSCLITGILLLLFTGLAIPNLRNPGDMPPVFGIAFRDVFQFLGYGSILSLAVSTVAGIYVSSLDPPRETPSSEGPE